MDRQKRVFTGDSNLLFSEKLFNNQYNPKKSDGPSVDRKHSRLLKSKQSINADATQET